MKRILIDCRWLSQNPRGIGIFNYGLIDGLKNISKEWCFDLEITLLVPYSFYKEASVNFGTLFKIIWIPRVNDPILDFLTIPFLQLFYKFDLIHFTGNTGSVLLTGGPKIITTIHDVSYCKKYKFNSDKSFRQKIGMIYRSIIARKMAEISNLIITVSSFAANDIKNEFNLGYMPIYIYHGVAVRSSYSPAFRNSNYFIVVSGADPQKNLRIVLEAFSKFRYNSDLPLYLYIVGISQEEYLKIYKNEVASSSINNIKIFGKLSHKDVLFLTSNARCTIVPSFYESFGLPALESLMLNVPVICSSTGAIKELANDASIYFDPTSADSLLEAIARFEAMDDIQNKIIKWRQVSGGAFCWEVAARKYLQQYLYFA